jgi:D-glycero-D-manno-heptose 1,7-bisphosphate phosphatase
VVTNQRGLALGRFTESALDSVHAALRDQLRAGGARVEGIYHCPHAEGVCGCRKPAPGLLVRAARDLEVPLSEAAMVGDAERDVEAGRRAGTLTVRLVEGAATSVADLTAPDLAMAVDLLLRG